MNRTTTFAIQAAAIPPALDGRDVLARAATGSGKTLGFLLPVVTRLSAAPGRRGRPRAVVLAPTRELAGQIAAEAAPLCAAVGIRTAVIFGGVSASSQVRAVSSGADLIVACPGRLWDLVSQGMIDLSAVEVVVLDEADHMADLGFLPTVRRILDATPRGGQRLLFSATLDGQVDVVSRAYLRDPVRVETEGAPALVDDAPVTHHVLHVSSADRVAVVAALVHGHDRTIVFTRTKHGARKLTKQLDAAGVVAVELHGNLAQNARERNLAAFSNGRARALVATDIAARGIHVDGVELVVHADPPVEHKAYTHRSGRTGRAGEGGVVVTLAIPEVRPDVPTLMRKAGVSATTRAVVPRTALAAIAAS